MNIEIVGNRVARDTATREEFYLTPIGKSVTYNCEIGLAVQVDGTGERAVISVAPNPITGDEKAPALRKFMEETAVGWLKIVAPERLTQEK